MKTALLVILVLLNLVVLSILGFLLYFFEVLWGMPRYTFTYIIPMILAALISIAAIFFTIRRKKWIWGTAGFLVTLGLLIFLFLQISNSNLCQFMLVSSLKTEQGHLFSDEDLILKTLFSNMSDDNHYVVVLPTTAQPGIENEREYLKEYVNKISPECSALVDRLIDINKSPVTLTLQSSREEGYIIDYDGEFASYFKPGDMGGWGKWRSSHPDARGSVEVSIPAYDSKSGFVLEYIGSQGDYLLGWGALHVYRYKHGKIIELAEYGLWIS